MGWRAWLGLDMTPARFVRQVSKVMQEASPGLVLTADVENFRLIKGEGDYINLHNVYHTWQNMPRRDRDQVIAHFVHSILNVPALPATFDAVRPLLLPALRRKSLLDYIQREAPTGTPNVPGYVHRDVGPDIALVLAIDAEQTISLVMDATFNGWGVTFEQALAVAMDNLRDRSADDFMPFDGVPGLVRSNWNDGYDSSRILLPDLMYRGVGSGNPVIMIPTRETLLLAPDHQPAALLAMLAGAGRALSDSSRWCSTAMYQLVDGKMVLYAPPDAAVREALRVLEREVAMADYADQKQQLDKLYERDGVDIFVASFGTMQKDGQIQSFCSWTDEVDAILPRTDVVALARNGPDEQFNMVLVDWQTLSARHGDLLQELPDFPPRYRVSAFPTELFEELLAAKQRAAVMQNAR